MQNGYVLSVTQLNEYVAGLLQRDVLLRGLTVRGEVSGFKRHSSGHVYFSLKDSGALIRCVMFRQDAMACHTVFADGMEIVATGNASLYVRDGSYQLYVKSVQREGEGELYRRFLMLKTRLQAKGYFDEARKKPIPALPKCVGIVTSATGAAVRDIISVARRRFPKMNLLLCPVAVQGVGAAEEIAEGIRRMNEVGKADVLIVGRGGGSMEDLWAFNEEVVAQAIFESRIPVVSAVGHETDFSIADFVADLRAPTPSAAAELCVPEVDTLLYALDTARETLLQATKNTLQRRRDKVEMLRSSSAFARPSHAVETAKNSLMAIEMQMLGALSANIQTAKQKHAVLQGQLLALSPAATLKRGFALVKDKNGVYHGSAKALLMQEHVTLCFHDGSVNAVISTKEKEQDQNGKEKA
ncbi:MAG: exodeoxyribonuclease VII large subunit [Clostridiales bacterium]|nr:exodeoxyribonuclease VII large subunit [Clostridiales bacterium]